MPVYTDNLRDRRGVPQSLAPNDATVSAWFGRPCDSATRVTVAVPLLGRIPFHKRVAPAIVRVFEDIEAGGKLGLIKREEFGGVYNCRQTRAGGRHSPHAWAIAIDLNIRSLARRDGTEYSSASRTNYLCAEWETAPSLRALAPFFWRWGFGWGGQWTNTIDPMHFEASDITVALLEGRDFTNRALFEARMKEEFPVTQPEPERIPVYVDGVHVDDGELHGNRTMIGLRKVLEAAGCEVLWDPVTRTVHVTTPRAGAQL